MLPLGAYALQFFPPSLRVPRASPLSMKSHICNAEISLGSIRLQVSASAAAAAAAAADADAAVSAANMISHKGFSLAPGSEHVRIAWRKEVAGECANS
jgi:hypothetical protein